MKKKRLVVVVDMINGFCKEGALASPRFMKTIAPNIKKLLDKERVEKTSRILFLVDCHKKDDGEFKLFPPHCIEGTDETKIIDELDYRHHLLSKDMAFQKSRYSPFSESGFDLWSWGGISPRKYEVVIVGNCTDICVHYTAEGFRSRGFEVIIPADCVDTFNLTKADCERLGLPESKIHLAAKINKFFLERHFPHILGIKMVQKVEEIL